MPFYLLVSGDRDCWPSSPSLCLGPLFSTYHNMDISIAGGLRSLVRAACLLQPPAEAEETRRADTLSVRLFPFRVRTGFGMFVLSLTHGVCCAYHVVSG